MKKNVLSFIAVLFLSQIVFSQKPLKVFLMAGQSNMVGNSDNNVLPPELKANQNNVKIYVFGTANFGWGPLRAGLGSIPAAYGSEVSFGYNIAKNLPNDSIAIIKGAWSGTDLATRWRPPSSGGTVGDLYTKFVDSTHAAIAKLGSGYQVEIVGMCWMQGESDAMNLTSANAYQTNLTNFIHDIRAEFNLPNLPFSIGKIMTDATYQYYAIVRQAEDSVVYKGSKISDFETNDLTISGGHYVIDGCEGLGERFANNMLILLGITPPLSNRPVWNFNNSGYSEGWTLTQNLTGNVLDGYLNLTITAANPYMLSPSSLVADTSIFKYLIIGLKNSTSDNKAGFFWITNADTSYDGNKRVVFDVNPNDVNYSTYIIDLSKNNYWTGNIKQIRLDPSLNDTIGNVSIDFIKLSGGPNPDQKSIAIPGIVEAENFNIGGEGIAYHDIDSVNNGGQYRPKEGVDIQSCSEGGYNVGWTNKGEWLEYTVNVADSGKYKLDLRLAAGTANNQFHVEFDGVDKTGIITINSTGGFQTWITHSVNVSLTAGIHLMRLFIDNSSNGLNINKITFTATAAGIEEKQNKIINVFPNPVTNEIKIQHLESGIQKIIIIDLLGKIILNYNLESSISDSQSIDVSSLRSGVYFIKIINNENTVTKKIIIQK